MKAKPSGCGAGVRGTLLYGRGVFAEVTFPLKVDKGKQLCQECRADSGQSKTVVASGT